MTALSHWIEPAGGNPCSELSDEVWCEPSVARLAGTYVVLVPLVLFAVHGGFSFEHPSWNSNLGAVGGKMAMVTSDGEAIRDRIQTSIGLALCLAAMAAYFRTVVNVALAMPLMTLLPVYATSSALWSQDPGTSLRSGFSLGVATLFAFFLARRFSERQQMELLMLAGAWVGAASAALVLGWPQFGLDHQIHEGAWQGLYTQKNACAEVTLFLLTPALALPALGRYGQMLRATYIAMCLLIIAMTQSRTGWAITLLYLAFVACLRLLGRFSRKELLPVAGLLFAIVGAGVVATLSYPALVLSLVGRSGGLSGREQIWRAIVASISRRPMFGYGLDAFWSLLTGEASRVFTATGWVVTSAHCGFLNVALELGLIGLALVLLTLLQACRDATVAFQPGHSGYVDWCIGIVFLTVVYNLDERTLMAPQFLPWVLYIVACTGLRYASLASRTREVEPELLKEIA